MQIPEESEQGPQELPVRGRWGVGVGVHPSRRSRRMVGVSSDTSEKVERLETDWEGLLMLH